MREHNNILHSIGSENTEWIRIWTVDEVIDPVDQALWHQLSAGCSWQKSSTQANGAATRHTAIANLDLSKIWARISNVVPEYIFGLRRSCFCNNRTIFGRYGFGEHFPPHSDAPHIVHSSFRSYYSVVVYLNDNFEGGETEFADIGIAIQAKSRMALIFPSFFRHAGRAVTRGEKLIVHSYLMYGKE